MVEIGVYFIILSRMDTFGINELLYGHVNCPNFGRRMHVNFILATIHYVPVQLHVVPTFSQHT